MHASVPRYSGPRLKQAPQSFSGCVQTNDDGCLRSRHGANAQQDTHSRGHHGDRRVQFSTAIAAPASPASSSERREPSFPASSARCWGSASSAPTAGRRRTTSPATTAGQHGSTCATAEPVPTHVRRAGIGAPLASGYRIAPASNRLQRNLYGGGYHEVGNYGAIDALPNPGFGPAAGTQEDDILAQKMADLMQNQFGLKPKMQGPVYTPLFPSLSAAFEGLQNCPSCLEAGADMEARFAKSHSVWSSPRALG
jgi:hypothetical protein